MKDYVERHLLKFCAANGYSSRSSGICTMLEDEYWKSHARPSDEYMHMVVIDGMMIGFAEEDCTGAEDGYVFYPDIYTVCEVDAFEETIIVYKEKGCNTK